MFILHGLAQIVFGMGLFAEKGSCEDNQIDNGEVGGVITSESQSQAPFTLSVVEFLPLRLV